MKEFISYPLLELAVLNFFQILTSEYSFTQFILFVHFLHPTPLAEC